jgi:hypothetical protein
MESAAMCMRPDWTDGSYDRCYAFAPEPTRMPLDCRGSVRTSSGQIVPIQWTIAFEVDEAHKCIELNYLPDGSTRVYRLGSSTAAYPPDSSSIIGI